MKKMIFIIILFAFSLSAVNVYSAFTDNRVKTWMLDGNMDGNWRFMYQDQWGGYNYQCRRDFAQVCVEWSWRAVYPMLTSQTPDPCPGNNTVDYGRNIIIKEAGITIPNDTTVYFTIEIVPYTEPGTN